MQIADKAEINFVGNFEELGSANWRVAPGRLLGWKLFLALIHNRRTVNNGRSARINFRMAFEDGATTPIRLAV